jgi:hypothetical protein
VKSNQKKPDDEMRMSEAEFERIMGQALQVKPDDAAKTKKVPKAADRPRKRRATKE